ncbi:hypothetical protein [Alkalicoccus urumqiensis]|uniref:BshB3 potential contributor to bacillithiol synthesis n=1 Tax=Alkalicoccus urumqiensis TaxID=1548213 RepID=A0A2P6ML06_ALKUR|nr:hypothetical protein [Alkalicoccus urumqiensis]PRO66960.1 hypothetical protein C6I21_03285 [Alkalicoccus urumqiensis]
MIWLIAAAALICILGLAATIMIGINPEDKSYDDEEKTKKHFQRIILLYVVAFIPLAVGSVVYFVFW